MKKIFAVALCVSAATIGAPALAQDAGGVSVGVTAGTLGIGPEVGFRVNENFGVRGSATFFNFSHTVDSDGVEYDGDLKLQSYGAQVDLYPFGSGFRLSAGGRFSENHVALTASPTGTVEIGDDTYTSAQVGVLTGRVEPKSFAPMATLGWGGGLTRGIKFGIDAGVLFQGTPKVTELSASGTLANDPDFKASLAREKAEIEDDIDNYKLYPVLQLSLGYRF